MRNVGHMKKYTWSPTSSEMTQIETKGGEHFFPRDIDTEATEPKYGSDLSQEIKSTCVCPTRVKKTPKWLESYVTK